jgi:glycosyltransferase involved in cell wall biosynthesis
VRPEDVPAELHPGDIGISFIVGSYNGEPGPFANLARAPTRFAEYLAAGMVVVAGPGIGDQDEVIEKERVGVVVAGESDADLQAAAERARLLAADPETWERARLAARERYTVEDGADRYLALYRRLT